MKKKSEKLVKDTGLGLPLVIMTETSLLEGPFRTAIAGAYLEWLFEAKDIIDKEFDDRIAFGDLGNFKSVVLDALRSASIKVALEPKL